MMLNGLLSNLPTLAPLKGVPRCLSGKESVYQCRRYRFNPYCEDTLEMATHSNNLASEIPWTKEPDGITKNQT